MFKAFNSIKEILLVFYQVLFVEAKERYEITEVYLEKYWSWYFLCSNWFAIRLA